MASGRKSSALQRTYSILAPAWATSFYPYSEVSRYPEVGQFCNYRVKKNSEFIQFFDNDYIKVKDVGWKLHILIPPAEMPRVWERLFPILQSEKISSFKVRHPAVTLSHQKEVTIYQYANPEKLEGDWSRLIKKIENALTELECHPGVLPAANKTISGSRFVSYRNDANVDGAYILDQKAVQYAAAQGLDASNLTGAADPFAHINIAEERRSLSLSY